MSSKRGYLGEDELEQYADITVTDTTEMDDQISMAEEEIDEYVGPQDKFLTYEIRGLAASASANTLTLESSQQSNMQKNYLKGCWIEIMGGTGEGQRKKITTQTYAGVCTVESNWSTTPDSTSYYRIWQLGKFPRKQDVEYDGLTTSTYYKSVPEKVRRAVAAQVEYKINMGDKFFSTDASNKTSESIGDYSYSKKESNGGSQLIAPKAQEILKGILNRRGVIVVD